MTTEQPLDPRVRAVLDGDYFDYREPLQQAWQWNRTGNPDDLRLAEQLLGKLAEEADYALAIWYERAFNLVKQGRPRRAEALQLLGDRIAPRFDKVLDVDTLSLWGRLLKDQAEDHRLAGRLVQAEAEYAKAEEKYDRSYREHRDRFPGVNVATIRLLRAALLKQIVAGAGGTTVDPEKAQGQELESRIATLRAASAERAAEVLASRGEWVPKLQDDAIWMAATEAEGAVLQGKWDQAEALYRAAVSADNKPLPHHFASIGTQLKRLCEAFVALGTPPPPPFDRPDAFLSALMPAPE